MVSDTFVPYRFVGCRMYAWALFSGNKIQD